MEKEKETEKEETVEMKENCEHEEKSITQNVFDALSDEIMGNPEISPEEKVRNLSRLMKIRETRINLMLVGATGCGKSSTVNALFQMERAKVGVGTDPETHCLRKYELDNLTIWDTPGLGDSVEADRKSMDMIQRKLMELDADGNPLIDIVLVIIDASQKDLGTVFECVNKVIVPVLGKEAEHRILIALNQADMAMKGNHWDAEHNCPDDVLTDFLDKKSASIGRRIKESTGIFFRPVYYCAGYKEDGNRQRIPYNLTKLLSVIVGAAPKEKRLVIADVLNPDESMWDCNDNAGDYKNRVRREFFESVYYWIRKCADFGFDLGIVALGKPGGAAGKALGALTGIFVGLYNAVFRKQTK